MRVGRGLSAARAGPVTALPVEAVEHGVPAQPRWASSGCDTDSRGTRPATEKSVGSWVSMRKTPAPVACGRPGRTKTASPGRTSNSFMAVRMASVSWRSIHSANWSRATSLRKPSQTRGESWPGIWPSGQHDPGLGLAELGVQDVPRELAGGVPMDRQPRAGVEELHKESRGGPIAGHDTRVRLPAPATAPGAPPATRSGPPLRPC